MKVIQLPIVNLELMQISELIYFQVELHDEFVFRRAKFWADEPVNIEDLSLGWVNQLTMLETVISKDAITGIEMFWLPKAKKFKICVFATGVPNDLELFFNKEKEARAVLDDLLEYKYGFSIKASFKEG